MSSTPSTNGCSNPTAMTNNNGSNNNNNDTVVAASKMITHWLAENNEETIDIDCLCLGTGRFLRSVLVPALVGIGYKPALIQTRGRSFMEYMASSELTNSYPIDTVTFHGQIETVNIPCYGAFSLGKPNDKKACFQYMKKQMKKLKILGVGVTEAGLASHDTQVMKDLYEILKCHLVDDDDEKLESNDGMDCDDDNDSSPIFVINMDNVPNNGNVIYNHMKTLAKQYDDTIMMDILLFDNDESSTSNNKRKVRFLNTMVDRITSQREDSNGMIPKCEPIPAKALVISDDMGELSSSTTRFTMDNNEEILKSNYGVIIRRENPILIQADIDLKLRIANATHTAICHCMALSKIWNTDQLSIEKGGTNAILLMSYIDSWFNSQILQSEFPANIQPKSSDIQYVYNDWRSRLTHGYFGLSTLFPTQNGAAKGGIRITPTIQNLIQLESNITVTTAYAYAALLRWLTPMNAITGIKQQEKYVGWFQGYDRTTNNSPPTNDIEQGDTTMEYVDQLKYNMDVGWYEFRCNCMIEYNNGSTRVPLSNILSKVASVNNGMGQQPSGYYNVIRAYLLSSNDGNFDINVINENPNTQHIFTQLVHSISTLYARMIVGDNLFDLLQEMIDYSGPYAKNGLESSISVLCDDIDIGTSTTSSNCLHYKLSPIPATSALLKVPIIGISENTTESIIKSVISSEVASTIAIDLHTHLLPPSHGSLCCWGIDELLTYHYLVAEYFMTACPSVTPDSFYELNKREQADLIWEALFIHRSPISEACRGVITTLVGLGLETYVINRDLSGIRSFYNTYRDRGLEGTEEFSELIFTKSGIQYAVMTNIPFDQNEVQYWRPKRKEYPYRYRSALRVDPLLAGDKNTIERTLRASGYDVTLEGAKQYLRDWCDTMKPEYMMASTPHDFVWGDDDKDNGSSNGKEKSAAKKRKRGINEDAMKQPFAFTDTLGGNAAADCAVACGDVDVDMMGSNNNGNNIPSIIDENSDFVSEVLMKICEERDLPIALKIGAHRGVNPQLKQAGDGIVAFADAGVLGRLCARFPKVLFLATFLSRTNQHEACVLATKFRNLHIYGCWWFCNNPSIIYEITSMRIEMLGTAFTAQHSDARVLDQLLYKWPHSRAVIANVLHKEYIKLYETNGWKITREEIRRDIHRLFGTSYEEFMKKAMSTTVNNV